MHAGWFTLKLVLRKYPVPETGQSLYAWKGTGLTLDMEYSSIFNFCSVTSANLTKVYRMKEFFSSFFSSANIIARAKVNITHSVSTLLPLQGASSTAHFTQGVASLATGLWTSAPFGACPLFDFQHTFTERPWASDLRSVPLPHPFLGFEWRSSPCFHFSLRSFP